MRRVIQKFDDIIQSLSPLDVDWMDDVAQSIMDRVCAVEIKSEYTREDIASLIDANSGAEFEVSRFCVGLFLGYSKDKLEVELKDRLGSGGTGIKRYNADRETYLEDRKSVV